jgi:hypothetical protein
LPLVHWSRPNNLTHGIIVATVDIMNGPQPIDVRIYYAKTLDNKRRDFRLYVADKNDSSKPILHPVVWLSTKENLIIKNQTSEKTVFEASFEIPLSGWLAFFTQFTFIGPDSSVHVITTETNIIPEIFPFEDCFMQECLGTLV